MSNSKIDEIKDKLKKLIAKEESARKIGNLHEAEAFAAKIQELITQYELDIEELKAHTAESTSVYKELVDTEPMTNRHESNWVVFLHSACSIATYCKVILHGKDTTMKIWLIGTELNRELHHFMVAQLLVKIRHLSREEYNKTDKSENKNTFIRSFLKGASDGIRKRLKDEKNAAAQAPQVYGLVLRKDAALKEFVAMEFPRLGVVQKKNGSSQAGYMKGYEAGQSVSINKGMDGSRPKAHIK